MKTKPRKLDYLALFLLGVAFAMPLQIMILYGHSPLEMTAVLAKLAPLNWLVLALAPLTAWLIYRASPLVLAAVPLLTVVVVHNNWFVSEMGTDYSPLTVGLSTGAFILAMGSLATREVRNILMNPGRRWWLTPKRKRVTIPVHVVVPGHGEYAFDSRTFDLSETGAFLVPEGAARALLQSVSAGTNCSLSFDLGRAQLTEHNNGLGTRRAIHCRAEVVRTTEGHGQYPSGVAIRFVDLGWEQKRVLRNVVQAA